MNSPRDVPYQLIGLTGKAGSGKDWVASNYFMKVGYRPLSFAWLLKWAAIAQGRVTWEEAFRTKPPVARKVLQQMGTEEWRGTYGDDCWVRGLDALARTLSDVNGWDRFVVADVRFPNEVDAIRALGGRVGRIVAPTRVAASGLSQEARQHISETALDYLRDEDFDFVVYNDPDQMVSTLDQLEHLFGELPK